MIFLTQDDTVNNFSTKLNDKNLTETTSDITLTEMNLTDQLMF